MRVAAIDVGTNTVRLLAVEFDDEAVHILDDFGEVTRLGASLIDTGRIDPEDAARTLAVVEKCVARARDCDVSHIDIIGTEVFRSADNGPDVAGEFSSKLGHALRILSPDDEAEAAYLGVVGWQDMTDPRPTLVIDVGGGSTQVILGEGIALNDARSVPAGALRLSQAHFKHDPPRPRELQAARKAADRVIKPLSGFSSASRLKAPHVVGVGGTVCAIGAWVHRVVPYDGARVDGLAFSEPDLQSAVQEWTGMDLNQRMERGGFSEGRARVVLGGGIILEALLAALGIRTLEVSTRGVRHGTVLRRVLLA